MQRRYNRLTAAFVNKMKTAPVPGKYADGDGLTLVITKGLVASWVYRFMIAGKSHEMGLGPLRHIGLAQARTAAYEARNMKREGTDPVAARRAKRLGTAVAKAKTVTFGQCAKAYITAHQKSWSAVHAHQWVQSLETHVYPVIGALPVEGVDTALVLKVLEPMWQEKPETASRVRGRIESVLDYAKTRELRSGENPARWRGHLENLLPKKSKIVAIKHYRALPYREIAAFMSELRQHDDAGTRALELAILCAARSGEVLKAKWTEFDLGGERLWTIPAARMKAKKEHRVPLSAAAIAILRKQQVIRSNDYVFAGRDDGPADKSTLERVVKRRLGRSDVTVHGFRSSFRDWCAELATGFPSEVAEMALAHKVGTAVEAAYRRSDLFHRRRALAEAWAAYCAGGAEVIAFPVEMRSA